MLTIDELKALGADTAEGLTRCMNNEDFYLRMVKMALEDDGFEKLEEAIQKHDLDEAFERAHSLKGVLGNVSLTSLLKPIEEITEELRVRNDIDYSDYLDRMSEQLKQYRGLL